MRIFILNSLRKLSWLLLTKTSYHFELLTASKSTASRRHVNQSERTFLFFLSKSLLLLCAISVTACQSTSYNSTSATAQQQTSANEEDALNLYILARNDYSAGKIQESEQRLLAVIQSRPSFSDAYLYLGNIYFRQDRLSDAHTMYGKALTLDKNNVSALYNASILDIVMAYEKLEQLELLLPETHDLQPSAALFKTKLKDSLKETIAEGSL